MEALLKLVGLSNTPENALYARSAIEWVKTRTTLKINMDDPSSLPANVQLFIIKYSQLMTINTGVASESISGMSQSFVTSQSLEMKIYELATALLGLDCLKSTVVVHSGESPWDYGC